MTTLRILEDPRGLLGDAQQWLDGPTWEGLDVCWWVVQRAELEPGEEFLILDEDWRGQSALIARGLLIAAPEDVRLGQGHAACYLRDPWGLWAAGPEAALWAVAIQVQERVSAADALPISTLYQRHQLSPSFWAQAAGQAPLSAQDADLLRRCWRQRSP